MMRDTRYAIRDLKTSIFLIFFFTISVFGFSQDVSISGIPDPGSRIGNWVLVIHGGAGGPPQGSMPEEKEQQYKEKLLEALKVGTAILEKGGSSMDAVEAVVMFMEDCPLFNAGKGAVYNHEGVAELDASIMDGRTLMAGAVTGVTRIKHPITAARHVMLKTRHVLLMGEGAELFAKEQGLELVDPSYFLTPKRTDQYKRMKKKREEDTDKTKGTVGAAALDNMGNLAAATSTGGLMMKMKGRIGDTPIIGAGTYANNATCAVSCTGTGEYFIRNVIAYDVSALMEYKGWTLQEAADFLINDKLKSQRGGGGLIAVDKDGNISMPYNTNAMFRGYAKAKGGRVVEIY